MAVGAALPGERRHVGHRRWSLSMLWGVTWINCGLRVYPRSPGRLHQARRDPRATVQPYDLRPDLHPTIGFTAPS